MARRPNSIPSWRDVLSDESMERMTLEPTYDAKGGVSGYRLVFDSSDTRARKREVQFETPRLHVSGGNSHMDGSLFKSGDDKKFTRWLSIKTKKTFDKNPGWLDKHPEDEADNEEYYMRVEALVERVRDLAWEIGSVRVAYLKLAIEDSHKEAVLDTLMSMSDKVAAATEAILKSETAAMRKVADKLKIDTKDPKWRGKAVKHLAADKSVVESKKFKRALRVKMLEYQGAAVSAMANDPKYAEDAELLESARDKMASAFRTWVFFGKESDDGEEMLADDPPHGTHRAKMRVFYNPRRNSGRDVKVRTLNFARATEVEVGPIAVKNAGMDASEIFHLEDEARMKGYGINRIKYQGKFPDIKHRLPDGSVVPFHEDPRVDVLLPGSIAQLIISFFIYVEPQIGMRMQFSPAVRVFERGPEYGRAVPDMDMDAAADLSFGDFAVDPEEGGKKRKRGDEPLAILPVGAPDEDEDEEDEMEEELFGGAPEKKKQKKQAEEIEGEEDAREF